MGMFITPKSKTQKENGLTTVIADHEVIKGLVYLQCWSTEIVLWDFIIYEKLKVRG